jgi:two-component system, OmpR family, sensor kinase
MSRLAARGSLFSKIFVHGLVVLIASAAAFISISALFVIPKVDRDVRREGRWLAMQLCGPIPKTDPIREDLPKELGATVYTFDGNLQDTFMQPPLPPVPAGDIPRLRLERALTISAGVAAYACRSPQSGHYVVLRHPGPPPFSWKLLVALILIAILVVAVASLPFARSIAKPMERVVAVTRAFGRGDLTARADATRKDEVGALGRAFNEMAEKLEALIRSEQEFLANVSHELRTPLSRIRVVLETAQEDPRRAQGLLAEIGIDLADLEMLVENVMETMRLDMASASVGAELPVSFRITKMQAVALEAVERFRRLHPQRELIFISIPEAVAVQADPKLLRRLLDNLLENARKYSDDSTSITVTLTATAYAATVHIKDQGIGIDTADLAHVFKPFFRGDRSRSRETGGAGLGLSLAKRIIDAHHGSILIESDPGKGTAVTFTVPRLSEVATRVHALRPEMD